MPLQAAGRLFLLIAADLQSAVDVARAAIQTSEPASLLVALEALLQAVGALSDRAGRACCGGAAAHPDDWLAPGAAAAMGTLESRGAA